MTSDNNNYNYLLHAAAAASVRASASTLINIAREVSNAPATISEFIRDILSEAPVYTIPDRFKGAARYQAQQIADLAATRRKSLPALLRFENVVDELIGVRPTERARR